MKALALLLIPLAGIFLLVSLSGCDSSGKLLFNSDARPLATPSTQPVTIEGVIQHGTKIAGDVATSNPVAAAFDVADTIKYLLGITAGAATTVAVKKARRNGKQERRTDRAAAPPPSPLPPPALNPLKAAA